MAWVADKNSAGAVSNGGLRSGIIGGGMLQKVVKANIDKKWSLLQIKPGVNIMLLSPFVMTLLTWDWRRWKVKYNWCWENPGGNTWIKSKVDHCHSSCSVCCPCKTDGKKLKRMRWLQKEWKLEVVTLVNLTDFWPWSQQVVEAAYIQLVLEVSLMALVLQPSLC